MSWLSPEKAIQLAGINLSVEDLSAYAKDNEAAEKFHQFGLKFSLERYNSGEKAFLQLEKEVYNFDHCTVKILIALLPIGMEKERQIIISCTTHEDFPLIKYCSLSDLGTLPQPIQELLEKLQADLPNRQIQALAKQSNNQKKVAFAPKPQSKQQKNSAFVQASLFGEVS